MGFEKPDTRYWDDKFAAYLHDPFDKVFQIKGHGERAADLLEIFGLQKPNEEFWKKADSIAAGFERGQVPSHSSDPQKNGAVDFQKRPVLTHPTSRKARLEMNFSDMTAQNIEKIHGELAAFLKENIGIKAGAGGYSDEFKGDHKRFAIARFLYTHLVLRFRLAHKNVGGIGALWHRLPADSRFPDHSIWQHNSLVSALYSCMSLAKDESQVGMMVFSITPVQGFIARARKLRDYWTGSILLSWLAFEGIRWIIENLGPDHILYPSLVDQPLINAYLAREWKTDPVSSYNTVKGIASFPNKFLFLLPLNQTKAIGVAITDHIRDAWSVVWREVAEKIISGTDNKNGHIKEMFERQNENFWDMQWATVKLLDRDDRAEFAELLPLNKFKKQWDILEIFNELIRDKPFYESSGRGILYSVSHSLVQAALAAQKAQKKITRAPEPGEKCHLCGEFEVLHAKKHKEGAPVTEYKADIDQFWERFKQGWKAEFDFEANERLCSVCLVKRIAYRVFGEKTHHILSESFRDMEFYPSTTQIALYNRFKRERITDKKDQYRIAQEYHQKPNEQAENRDSYYAILLMDGDHMGKLVNGETLASTWDSAMHPDIVKRLNGPSFSKKYQKAWETIFADHPKRLLTPSIHAAISEALGDFSIYGVAKIVKQNEGRLIYAGGDDV
ncbi:MAG: type III-B CRISPR-associated protein Cas10/Cmr2, partial [Deltaproteobacteria bacterium]|nr:type III-B CRISPR-associated protein Cas10/Cmr2 [Deltaproteobacteria bacterium]